MSELENKLLGKAQRALFNQSEITEEVVKIGLNEAIELTNNKPISETLLLDLALYRVKENLKVELTEYEQKSILRILKKADEISVNELDEVVKHSISYGTRGSIWDI